MAIVEAILFLIELLIKAALLIFIWLVFAISLLVVLALFGITILVMLAISVFSDTTIDLKANQLTVTGAITISTGYEVGSVYNDFLGLEIPTIESYFESAEFRYDFSYNFLSLNLGLTKLPEELFNLTRSIATIVSSMGKIMTACGGFFGVLATILNFKPTYLDGGLSLILGIGSWSAVIGILIYGILVVANDDEVKKEAYIGMGIGFIISGVAALMNKSTKIFKQVTSLKAFKAQMKTFKDLFKNTKKVLKIEHMADQYPGEELEYMLQTATLDLLLGSIALMTGTVALRFVWDAPSQNIAIYGMGIICLVVGIYLIKEAFLLGNE